MPTALWLIWQVAHLLGLPLAVGFWLGHRTGRKDAAREHARHRRTDPACVHYAAPKPGSRLDRASRGLSCRQCMPAPDDVMRWPD